MPLSPVLDATRRSWNQATRNHNQHKGDQAARFRSGEDPLFPEELELLGPLAGKSLVHLQCNAGQDTLGLARRGARCLGVDLADEAIAFATTLSADTAIAARFLQAELLDWMHSTEERFDLAFSSYGAVPWIADLDAWAAGIARVLVPGGRFVYVEFHPLVWSVGADLRLSGDDYFASHAFIEPVGDYVAASALGLGGDGSPALPNDLPATGWQHSVAAIVDALARAGLILERLTEYPYANGCRVHAALVDDGARRWVWPEGTARLPLMFGLSVRAPA